MSLEALSGLAFDRPTAQGPGFYRACFTVENPQDAQLVMAGCEKGMVWVNGFNLGRYWEIGPQQSLYCPAGLLRPGENELIVLDLAGGPAAEKQVCFAPRPQWDITAG